MAQVCIVNIIHLLIIYKYRNCFKQLRVKGLVLVLKLVVAFFGNSKMQRYSLMYRYRIVH